MSGFTAEWLALREAADTRARSRDLIATLPRLFPAIIDLGAGTGANLRWLAPQLDSPQDWVLIDNDSQLLVAARKATRAWAETLGYQVRGRGNRCTITGPGVDCRIRTERRDLATSLDDLELPAGCLLTASALLDLVSRRWLEKLVARIAETRASVLWALTYDGRVTIDPAIDDDQAIVDLLNRHQLTDKGFGPALGPDAWLVARSLLESAGLEVRVVDSSWKCDREDRALVLALISGWADAAAAMAPADRRAIRRWHKHRHGQASKGRLEVAVGHRDLAAWPGAADGSR